MAISEKGVAGAKKIKKEMTDAEIMAKAKDLYGASAGAMDIDKLRKEFEEGEFDKILKGKNKDGGKPKLKEGDNTDFGMLSVEAGIDNNPKPTQADRIAGATKNEKKKAKGGVRTAIAKIKKAKDGARTGVRGTGAAKSGFRKAKLS